MRNFVTNRLLGNVGQVPLPGNCWHMCFCLFITDTSWSWSMKQDTGKSNTLLIRMHFWYAGRPEWCCWFHVCHVPYIAWCCSAARLWRTCPLRWRCGWDLWILDQEATSSGTEIPWLELCLCRSRLCCSFHLPFTQVRRKIFRPLDPRVCTAPSTSSHGGSVMHGLSRSSLVITCIVIPLAWSLYSRSDSRPRRVMSKFIS